MSSIRSLLLSSLLLPLSALAQPAQQTPPIEAADTAAISRIDMAALVECRLGHDEFQTVLPILMQPLKAVSIGWQPLPRANMFMSEYRLTQPVTVFGHRTDHLAFSGDAAFAILDLPDPRVLARELKLDEGIDTPEKVMLGKEVSSEDMVDPATGRPTGIIASAVLTVSNVASHPGRTLVGCSYSRYQEEPGQSETDRDAGGANAGNAKPAGPHRADPSQQ
ncbi:MAG: hypothetical protein LBL59_10985 [Xanthomonadaceae bacterium]|jgi:hypothetical protein|nr:hypothetical protein [Xanthomonadaceae bacterium]